MTPCLGDKDGPLLAHEGSYDPFQEKNDKVRVISCPCHFLKLLRLKIPDVPRCHIFRWHDPRPITSAFPVTPLDALRPYFPCTPHKAHYSVGMAINTH